MDSNEIFPNLYALGNFYSFVNLLVLSILLHRGIFKGNLLACYNATCYACSSILRRAKSQIVFYITF